MEKVFKRGDSVWHHRISLPTSLSTDQKTPLPLSVGPFMNISGGNVFLGKQLLSQACSLPPLNMYILEEATTAMENKKPTHLRNK